jgi:hypothetical protein
MRSATVAESLPHCRWLVDLSVWLSLRSRWAVATSDEGQETLDGGDGGVGKAMEARETPMTVAVGAAMC